MKTLRKLKLAELNKVEMEKQELNKLRGGGCCICRCGPDDYSESTLSNAGANNSGNLFSPAGGYGNGSFG